MQDHGALIKWFNDSLCVRMDDFRPTEKKRFLARLVWKMDSPREYLLNDNSAEKIRASIGQPFRYRTMDETQ